MPPTMEALGPIMPIVTALNQTLPQINLSEFLSDALQLFGAGERHARDRDAGQLGLE